MMEILYTNLLHNPIYLVLVLHFYLPVVAFQLQAGQYRVLHPHHLYQPCLQLHGIDSPLIPRKMDKNCFCFKIIEKPLFPPQQPMFEHQSEVLLHLCKAVEHGDGDPEHIEGPEEKVGGGIDGDKAEGIDIIEVELIGDEDAQISDGQDSHKMRHPPQEEEITKGLKTALVEHVVLVETADVLDQFIQRLDCPKHMRILSNSHLHSILQIPYLQSVQLIPKHPPEHDTRYHKSPIQPEKRSDELPHRDGVVLHVESRLGSCEAAIAHNYYRMDEKMKIPGHIVERRKELERKLVESGEMERLEEYLRKKLVASGWKENLKSYCKDLVREKGIEKVTVQSLVDQLETRGKHTIPVTIREDLLSRVRKFLEQNK